MQAEVAGVRRELIVRERLMRVFLASLGDVTAALGGEKARQTGGEITTASSSSSVVQGRRGNNRAITAVTVLITAMIIFELYDEFIVRIDQSEPSLATMVINLFL